MRKLLLTVMLWGTATAISAQSMLMKPAFCDSCEHELSLRFQSTSFLKNDEYFNDFAEGFTGLGFFVKPTFEYYFSSKTRVNLGAYLLKYSGVNGFSEAIPVFSVHHQFSPKVALVLGSIYGTLYHRLDEPLMRFDRFYKNNMEYGLQLIWKSSRIESDTWINWERFIFKDDPFQEEFVAGHSSYLHLLRSDNLDVTLPFQVMIAHKGGQIDTSPDPAVSIVNASSGLLINLKKTDHHVWSIDYRTYLYKGLDLPDSGANSQHFDDGIAHYAKLNYRSKRVNAMLGYWYAERYIAPRGEYLFQNISEVDEDYFQEKRKMITAKLSYNYRFQYGIRGELRGDAYYDIPNDGLSFSVGIYFVIDELIFLKKMERKSAKKF